MQPHLADFGRRVDLIWLSGFQTPQVPNSTTPLMNQGIIPGTGHIRELKLLIKNSSSGRRLKKFS
jgi:hypothetical protein